MLYNRTRTYSLFQLNRDSRHPRVIRRSFCDFRHFCSETLHAFDGSRTGIHKFMDRKSESERHLTNELALHVNNASTHGTRRRPRRCVHPFDARMILFLTATDSRWRHPARGVGFHDASRHGIAPASDRRRTRETIDARIPDRRGRFRRVSRRDVDVDRCKHFVWFHPTTTHGCVD